MKEDVIRNIEENRQRKLDGDVIAIPYPFPRLSRYLPGIEQGKYHLITSSSKGGKSQFANFVYVFSVVDWYMKNRDQSSIKPKIFYFSLEISKFLIMLSAISYRLYTAYNITISPNNLRSVFEDYTLDENILNIIKSKEFQEWLTLFEEIVVITDDIRNPTGIYKTVKAYAEANGKYVYSEMPWQKDDGSFTTRRVIDKYIPNDPDEYVIVLTDNLNLLSAERDMSQRESIGKFSNDYCLTFRDRFNYIIANIIQQSADSVGAAFDNRGNIITERVKPTPEGIGENKTVIRDVNLILGIFYPYKYNIETYEEIALNKIGNYHRELSVLLNRDGLSNLSVQLFFLGACNFFKELPREINSTIYEGINNVINNEIK